MLNAVQQLAGALGVAVIGTVFFSAVTHHGFAVAFRRTLLVDLLTVAITVLLVLGLPMRAREDQQH